MTPREFLANIVGACAIVIAWASIVILFTD
jgi:hypothetical protein